MFPDYRRFPKYRSSLSWPRSERACEQATEPAYRFLAPLRTRSYLLRRDSLLSPPHPFIFSPFLLLYLSYFPSVLNCWYGYFLFVRSCIFSRFVFFPIRPVCFLCGRVSPAALFHFFIICCQSLLCNSATVASLLASFPPALISCASHASTQSASSSCAPSLSTFAIPSVGGISRLLLAFALKAFDLFGVFFFWR